MGDLDECGLVGRFTLALAPTNDALPHVLRCPRCRFLSSTQWHDLTFVPNNAHSPIERHHTNITENTAIHSSVISETHFNTHAILTLYSHDVASRIGPHLSHTRVFAIDPPALFAATCHTLMLTACEAIAHLTNPPDSHTSIKQEKSVIGNGDSSTLVQSDHGDQEIHHSGQGGMDFITLYAKPRTSITLDSRVKIIPLQSHVDHSEQVGELSSFASHCQQCYIPSYLSQHESWEYAKVLSDLVCGNRALHRVVMLSRSSDYFHAMFCGELSNSKKPSFLNEADFTSHVIDTALSRCYGIPISTQPRQVDWVPCYSLATYWGDLSMQKELIELAKSEVQKHGLIPFTEAFKESHTLPPPLQHAWNTLQEHYLSLLCESNRLIYVESPYVAISADALKWLATQDPIWKLSESSRAQILISWIRATPRELQEQRDVVRCWLETCLDISLLPSCYVHDLHIDTETKACTKPLKPGKIKAAHTEHKRPNLNLSGLYNVPDEKLAEFTKKPFSCVNLRGCWRLSNSAIKFFSLQQNNIEELYLDDCTSLRCEIPEVLFMRLKAFSARRTPICVIPSFKPSKSAKKLQVLLLSGCLWLKGSFLKKLLRQFGPTLKSVSLDDCPNITQDDFEDYLPAMAKIQDFCIDRLTVNDGLWNLFDATTPLLRSISIVGCALSPDPLVSFLLSRKTITQLSLSKMDFTQEQATQLINSRLWEHLYLPRCFSIGLFGSQTCYQLGHWFQNLETLDVRDNCSLPEGLFSCIPMIKKLKCGWGFGDNELLELGRNSKCLESLMLTSGARVTDFGIQQISKIEKHGLWLNLRKLRFDLLMGVSTQTLSSILGLFCSLRSLHINYILDFEPDLILKSLSRGMVRLKTLSLRGVGMSISDESMSAFFNSQPALEKLHLQGVNQLTASPFVDYCTRPRYLRSIDLQECPGIRGCILKTLTHQNPMLQKLTLRHCGDVLANALEDVVLRNGELQYLHIDNCDLVEKGIDLPTVHNSDEMQTRLSGVHITKCKRVREDLFYQYSETTKFVPFPS